MKIVNQPLRKKDAMQLVTGQRVYTDDLASKDCLIVKVLRSPHANAIIESINTAIAAKVPDVEAIFTYEDVDQDARRCTYAGQTYPEPSEDEIKEYLAGNLCRCSGYEGQLRGIQNFIAWKKAQQGEV